MAVPPPLPRVPSTDDIVPTMQRIIHEHDTIRSQILQGITPDTATFENVMLPLAHVENAVQGELAMIDMLQYGSPSLATQAAFDEARKLYLKACARWVSEEAFFKLLQAAREKPCFQTLDMESQHLLERELLDYKHAGHGILSELERLEFQEAKAEIADLERTFQQNVAREDGGVYFTLEELDGVPVSELEKWKNVNDVQKLVPFANGGERAVLTHAHSPKTRKTMFLANNRKLEANKSLLEEIIRRRAMQARSLNRTTHAELRIERRMAPGTEWVEQFLGQLKYTLSPHGQKNLIPLQRGRLEDLQARGKQCDERERFPPWDKQYYERLLQQDLKIDQLRISEFFPLHQTMVKMLGIFASSLGLRFDPVPADRLTEETIWHPTVGLFSVWDTKNDEFVGYLYHDLLWREHKYRGNQSVNIQCGYLRPDGTRQYPSTILMCSFPTPTATSCALLQHSQVVTLFHEMGHCIHDLLARTKYVRFHGYHLPPDFGEMPSIMLENWCWMKDVLQGLSCHYSILDQLYLADWRKQHSGEPDPPEKIPLELVGNLIQHRYQGKGLSYLFQLSVSIFDLQIHSLDTSEAAGLDVQKLWYDIREEIEGMDFSECRDGFGFGSFTHLTAGYDVGYYSYLCCTAMAQDLFLSRFAPDPHNIDMWDRYRRGILEYGGSPPRLLDLLESFLGRSPNMNALGEGLGKV